MMKPLTLAKLEEPYSLYKPVATEIDVREERLSVLKLLESYHDDGGCLSHKECELFKAIKQLKEATK